jgi:hypothetical protein
MQLFLHAWHRHIGNLPDTDRLDPAEKHLRHPSFLRQKVVVALCRSRPASNSQKKTGLLMATLNLLHFRSSKHVPAIMQWNQRRRHHLTRIFRSTRDCRGAIFVIHFATHSVAQHRAREWNGELPHEGGVGEPQTATKK